MKNKKGIIISVIVLTIVMLCSFVGGGVLVARGAVDVVKDINLPEKLSQLGISDGLSTAVNYLKYISGSVAVGYNDAYILNPYVIEGVSAENVSTLVIENIGYDITLIGSQREDIELSFVGKYPDSVDGERLFSCNADASGATLTISAADMPYYFDSSVGAVTICVPDKSEWNIVIIDCTGDAEISNINAATFTVENYAGEITAEGITADMLKLHSIAGEINLDGKLSGYQIDNLFGSVELKSYVSPTENCSIKNCIGELYIKLPVDTVLNLVKSSSYADIRCQLEESESGAKIGINNFIGQITFDAEFFLVS